MRDLVVSQDQDMGAGSDDRHVLYTYVTVKTVFAFKQGQNEPEERGAPMQTKRNGNTAHALAPATGIIVGIGLSTMLWSFIILVVFWIR